MLNRIDYCYNILDVQKGYWKNILLDQKLVCVILSNVSVNISDFKILTAQILNEN